MKKILLSLVPVTLGAASAFACPGERFTVHQISLDAKGVVTRSEMREIPTRDSDESQKTTFANVVVDRLTLGVGDEIRLNAAPGIVDATIILAVKRSAQESDRNGILSTTYEVREITTSGWGGGTTEKLSSVKITAKGCGSVEVTPLSNARDATLRP